MFHCYVFSLLFLASKVDKKRAWSHIYYKCFAQLLKWQNIYHTLHVSLVRILLNYIYSVIGVRCWQIPVINYETFIVLYSEVHVSMYNWVIALTELIIYLKINKLDWAFLYQVIDSNKMKCDSCGFQWPTPSQMDYGKYKNASSNIINIKS